MNVWMFLLIVLIASSITWLLIWGLERLFTFSSRKERKAAYIKALARKKRLEESILAQLQVHILDGESRGHD